MPRLTLLALALTACAAPPREAPEVGDTSVVPGPPVAVGNPWERRMAALRASGAEYVARGNEPGWMVVVWPDSIVLVDNYGQDTVHFAGVVPDREGVSTLWATADDSVKFNLSISTRPCTDDMSGEPFPLSARYLHGIRTRVGCAVSLR